MADAQYQVTDSQVAMLQITQRIEDLIYSFNAPQEDLGDEEELDEDQEDEVVHLENALRDMMTLVEGTIAAGQPGRDEGSVHTPTPTASPEPTARRPAKWQDASQVKDLAIHVPEGILNIISRDYARMAMAMRSAITWRQVADLIKAAGSDEGYEFPHPDATALPMPQPAGPSQPTTAAAEVTLGAIWMRNILEASGQTCYHTYLRSLSRYQIALGLERFKNDCQATDGSRGKGKIQFMYEEIAKRSGESVDRIKNEARKGRALVDACGGHRGLLVLLATRDDESFGLSNVVTMQQKLVTRQRTQLRTWNSDDWASKLCQAGLDAETVIASRGSAALPDSLARLCGNVETVDGLTLQVLEDVIGNREGCSCRKDAQN